MHTNILPTQPIRLMPSGAYTYELQWIYMQEKQDVMIVHSLKSTAAAAAQTKFTCYVCTYLVQYTGTHAGHTIIPLHCIAILFCVTIIA